MILDEMKEISSGHLIVIAMKIVPAVPAELGLWSGNRRFQERLVPNLERSPVPFNVIAMNLQHLVHREEERLHSLFSELPQRGAILSIHFSQAVRNFFRRAASDVGVTIRRFPSVVMVSGVSVLIFQQVKDPAIDHERQTVAMLGQFLNHLSLPTRYYNVYP
jgi:hypothetical protein